MNCFIYVNRSHFLLIIAITFLINVTIRAFIFNEFQKHLPSVAALADQVDMSKPSGMNSDSSSSCSSSSSSSSGSSSDSSDDSTVSDTDDRRKRYSMLLSSSSTTQRRG